MDRGLWSLGSVIIGTAAAGIGMEWTFALCGAVCAAAGAGLLIINRRYHAEVARHAADYRQRHATIGSVTGMWLGIFGTRVLGLPSTPELPAPSNSILPLPVLQSW